MASKLKLTNAHIGMAVVLDCIKLFRHHDIVPERDAWPFLLANIDRHYHAEVWIRGINATFLVKKSDIKKVF